MVDVSPVATPANLKRRRPIPLSVALAMGWVALMVFIGIFADVRPYSITQINLAARLSPPLGFGGTTVHILGTDELGRDPLSRLMTAIRISLMIAFGATVLGVILGGLLGLLAAHFRGMFEQVTLVLIDVQAALPFLARDPHLPARPLWLGAARATGTRSRAFGQHPGISAGAAPAGGEPAAGICAAPDPQHLGDDDRLRHSGLPGGLSWRKAACRSWDWACSRR